MALPLETKIMEEIGIGNNYHFFNGSGSCRYIRIEASKNLSKYIEKYHNLGEKISLPDNSLISIVKEIANNPNQSEYTLTDTWEAVSYVIAEHIHQADSSENNRKKAYKRLAETLKVKYLNFKKYDINLNNKYFR